MSNIRTGSWTIFFSTRFMPFAQWIYRTERDFQWIGCLWKNLDCHVATAAAAVAAASSRLLLFRLLFFFDEYMHSINFVLSFIQLLSVNIRNALLNNSNLRNFVFSSRLIWNVCILCARQQVYITKTRLINEICMAKCLCIEAKVIFNFLNRVKR